jgi:hypothetical protein
VSSEETFLLEIVLNDADLRAAGSGGRSDIEGPLEEELVAAGVGEVTGGGGGMGLSNIDVAVTDRDQGLAFVRRVLRELEVPPSTIINVHQGDRTLGTGKTTTYLVYDQS